MLVVACSSSSSSSSTVVSSLLYLTHMIELTSDANIYGLVSWIKSLCLIHKSKVIQGRTVTVIILPCAHYLHVHIQWYSMFHKYNESCLKSSFEIILYVIKYYLYNHKEMTTTNSIMMRMSYYLTALFDNNDNNDLNELTNL